MSNTTTITTSQLSHLVSSARAVALSIDPYFLPTAVAAVFCQMYSRHSTAKPPLAASRKHIIFRGARQTFNTF